jgi:hypothetical protein
MELRKSLRLLSTAVFLTVVLSSFAFAGIFTDYGTTKSVNDDGNGKGIAFADINNDGFVDMYVSNKGGANKLLMNNGDGSFKDITKEAGAGLDDAGFCMGSVFGDIDNDGLVDLYVPKGGRIEVEANRLFKNLGDGKFVEITDKAGVGCKEFSYSAAMADYDNDGFLDIYIANYGVGAKNVLYRNNGDSTFSDVTNIAGVGDASWSWNAIFADVNNDGNADIYVVNGRDPAGEPNKLYINNGDSTFSDVSKEAGVADANWGLGASFADTDNDGDLDLFISNYVGPNKMFLNDGTGKFEDISKQAKLDSTSWGKGPSFADINHDGFVDLYEGDCKVANQLYINNGDNTFTDIADEVPELKCDKVRTKGTAFADIDNDGDMDLYVVNWAAPNKLFVNEKNDGNFLEVKLTGVVSNADAIGSKVKIMKDGKLVAYRELQTASGFCAQSQKILHFGLDSANTYDVVVTFPSGNIATLKDVKPGQIIEVKEPVEKDSTLSYLSIK